MSTTIDQKVVEMRFDNKQFEEATRESMSTLDKLKSKLDFKGTEDGFEDLGYSADETSGKFKALEIAGITALVNITNQAVDTGKKLIASLSVDNISAGWDKFSQNTTAVGTLIAQGFDQSEVDAQLERLLWFTDETSYNFVDMVNSIAKFTASGKGLEESVEAMEGIANWAAMSGQNAQTASRAMYQISQAMSSGAMRRQDWMSITNANMDNKAFRELAIQKGLELGTLRDLGDGTYQALTAVEKEGQEAFNAEVGFIDRLTSGMWLNSDVMMATFKAYNSATNRIYEYQKEQEEKYDRYITANEAMEELQANGEELDEFALKAFKAAQEARTFTDVINAVQDAVSTGWMKTFENVFGNYSEVKVFWTDLANELYDVFAEGRNIQNGILKQWKDLGGRDLLFNNDEENGPLGAFWNLFYAITDIINAVKEAFRDIFPRKTGEELLKLTEMFRNFTERLRMSDETSENLKRTLRGLFSILGIPVQIIKNLLKFVGKIISAISGVGDKSLIGTILALTANIGDLLTKFHNWLKDSELIEKALNKVWKLVLVVAGAFKNFIKTVKEKFNIPGLDEIQKKIVEFARKVKNDLTEAFNSFNFEEFKKQISDTFRALKQNIVMPGLEKAAEILKKIVGFLKDIKNGIFGSEGVIHSFATFTVNAFNKIVEIFGKLKKAVKESVIWKALLKLWELIKSVVSNFVSAVKELRFDDILTALEGVVKIIVGLEIWKIIKSFKKGVSSITAILDGVADSLKAYSNDLNAKAILKIALSLILLATAIYMLSGIDNDSLERSVTVIAALAAVLAVLMKTMVKTSTVGNTFMKFNFADKSFQRNGNKTASILLGMSVAMIAFAIAITKIVKASKENPQAVFVAIAGIMLLLASFASFIKQIQDAKFEKSNKITSIFLSMSLVIDRIGSSISKIAKNDVNSIIAASAGLAIVIYVIMHFLDDMLGWMKTSKRVQGEMKGLAKIFLGLSLFVTMLAFSLKILASMESEKMWESIGAITAILAILFVFITALGKILNGPDTRPTLFQHVGAGIKSLAFSLLIFAAAIAVFSLMDWNFFLTGLWKMASVLAVVAIAVLALRGALGKKPDKAGEGVAAVAKAMTKLAFGLLIMAAAVAILAQLPIEGLGVGLLGLAGMLGIVVGFAWLAQKTKVVEVFPKLAKGMALFGLGLLAVSVALILFAQAALLFGTASLAIIAGAAAIGAALVALLAAFIKGLPALIPDLISAVAQIYAAWKAWTFVWIVQFIQDIIPVLEKIVPVLCDFIKNQAGPLIDAVLYLLVVLLQKLANYIGPIVDALIDIVINILDALVGKLGPLLQQAFDPAKFVQYIAIFLAAIGLMKVATFAKALAKEAMIGVLYVGAFIAELAVIIAALGAIYAIPGVEWLITKGGDLLQALGYAIGQAIGGIIGGLMAGVMSGMPAVATYLSQFMQNLKPFLDGCAAITPQMADGVELIVTMLLALTAGALVESIMHFIGGSVFLYILEFAESLPVLGESIMEFAEITKGIDADSVTASANAGKTLAELANALPRQGGLWGKLAGEVMSLTEFAKEIVNFAPAIVEYSKAITSDGGVDGAAVENSANAGMALSELANSLPRKGGFWQALAGEVMSLTEFAEGIIDFAPAIVAYSNAIVENGGINEDAVQNSVNAGKIISDFAKSLPKDGGFWQDIVGHTMTLTEFATELNNFAPAIVGYSRLVSEEGAIDETAVAKSILVADMLAYLADNMPTIASGISEFFSGEHKQTLSEFGDSLLEFAPKYVEFSQIISDTKFSSVDSFTKTLIKLMDPIKTIADESYDWDQIEDVADNLPDLGEALKDYGDSIGGLSYMDLDKLGRSFTAMSEIIKAFSGIEHGAFTGFSEEFGELIGKFPGFKMTMWKILEEIGPTNFNTYGSALKHFFEFTGSINEGAGQDILALSRAINLLGNKSSKLEDLGEALASLAPNLSSYSYNIKNTDLDAVEKSISTIEKLVGLESKLHELSDEITVSFSDSKNKEQKLELTDRKKNFETFGEEIVAIGTALKKFNDILVLGGTFANAKEAFKAGAVKYNSELVNGAIDNVGAFVDIADKFAKIRNEIHLGGSDGITIVGETLTTMAGHLNAMGPALVEFSNKLGDKNYSSDKVKKGTDAIKDVFSAFSKLEPIVKEDVNIDSFKQAADWFYGGLPNTARGIANFARVIHRSEGFDDKDKEKFTNAFDILKNVISNTKGIIDQKNDILIGDTFTTIISDYVAGMKTLKDGLNDYAESFGDFSWDSIARSNSLIKTIIGLTKTISEINTDSLLTFSDILINFADIAASDIPTLISEQLEDVEQAGKDIADALVRGFETVNHESLETRLNTAILDILKPLTNNEDSFTSIKYLIKQTGKSYVSLLLSAFEEYAVNGGNLGPQVSPIVAFSEHILLTLRAAESKFRDAGIFLRAGFIQGLKGSDNKNPYKEVKKAGEEMGKAAVEGLKKGTEEKSPSKASERAGIFFDDGFIIGMAKKISDAYKSGKEVGENAKQGLSDSIAKVAAIANDEVDLTPTIRPVVDLTDVRRGIGDMDGLFSYGRSMDLSARINRSMGDYMSRDTNISVNNDDVVAAISELRSDMREMQETVGDFKIVMDTGALVGSIKKPMDKELGRELVYSGRRN